MPLLDIGLFIVHHLFDQLVVGRDVLCARCVFRSVVEISLDDARFDDLHPDVEWT